MTTHVVMFSGGIGSWATARRAQGYMRPGDELVLLFADVRGDSTEEHVGEDEDTYRFIVESAARMFGVALQKWWLRPWKGREHTRHGRLARQIPGLVRVADGRTIWEVFRDDRFLGNSRLANCSKFLKQKPSRDWLEANCSPADTIVYIGIDWTEVHRIPAIEKAYLPYATRFPMTEAPYLDKQAMLDWARSEGLEPPRAYALGYAHNNCGGGCVRSGQAQFKKLLELNPERFEVWEQKERELRNYLDKDVTILRDRRGGVSKTLPLTVLRREVQGGQEIDELDVGGCGCFVETEA